jgi:probable HAF family extracellular repeat protein
MGGISNGVVYVGGVKTPSSLIPRAASGVLGLCATVSLNVQSLGQTPGFRFVGFPTDSPRYSIVRGLSADGRVAAGNGQAENGIRGFTWTETGGLDEFGLLPTMPTDTRVFGLSADASTVVGQTTTNAGLGHAYRYSGGTTIQDLGTINGWRHSEAVGVSGDGSVVVGTLSDTRGSGGQAFRWTAAAGMQALGGPIGQIQFAAAVSRDGTKVVGTRGGANGSDAYVWTEAGGFQNLPSLPGSSSGAGGMNSDGSIIVGQSGANQASMWRGGVVQLLGNAPGFASSVAYATDSTGSVAVGRMFAASSFGYGYVWTASAGPQLLEDYLAGFHLSFPAGWRSEYVSSISDDGRSIGGWAINSSLQHQGFVVTIPSPSAIVLGIMIGLSALTRRVARTHMRQRSPGRRVPLEELKRIGCFQTRRRLHPLQRFQCRAQRRSSNDENYGRQSLRCLPSSSQRAGTFHSRRPFS